MKSITRFNRDTLNGETVLASKKLADTSFELHWHDYYEIILYKNCKGECFINNVSHKIDGTCLFLLTPKDFHEINNEVIPDSQYLKLEILPEAIDTRLSPLIMSGPIAVSAPSQNLISLINEMFAFDFEREKKLFTESLINCILIRIINEGNLLKSHFLTKNPIILNVLSEIIASPFEAHTVKKLARKQNVNSDYFSWLFHKEVGVTFKQYLTSLRIEYAKHLLKSSDLSIIDICYDSGFNSPDSFYRAFKKHTSMTPKEWQKNKR